VGGLTRTVHDAALLLSITGVYDEGDPDAEPHADADYVAALRGGLAGIRVGVPERLVDTAPVEPDVREAFHQALDDLRRFGARVAVVEVPLMEQARAANFVVLNAEHYAAHASLLGPQWARYGKSARLYQAQGAFLTAADYIAAREVGRMAGRAVDAVLTDLDLLAMPTSPVVTVEAARRPEAHRRGMVGTFTGPFNLTGHPAFSVPCGMSAEGLPIGLQLVGRRYGEPVILRAAYAYEQATAWHARHAAELSER
jgi:aspartyl-tRNA(Asn)/glutamyl-tRNA(Gln) amidotransferase subunit A